MRFPLRLTAALYKAQAARLLGGASSNPIAHIVPGDATPVAQTAPPIVWMAGGEPVLHSEIGRIVKEYAEAKRFVFLQTSGYNLRQRIHALQPSERLFLTVEFAGQEAVHNQADGRVDAFRRSMEGIRAAKLSGFFVAAHIVVTEQTDPCDIGELIEFLDKIGVDGFIATSRGRSGRASGESLAETLDDVRTLIRSSQWEKFSRLLEESFGNGKLIPSASENAYEEGD